MLQPLPDLDQYPVTDLLAERIIEALEAVDVDQQHGRDVARRARLAQDLLAQLQESRELTYVFISHDMDTVRHFCTRVAVMRNGKFVEEGATQQVLEEPQHAYTQALMKAAMKPIPFRGQQGQNAGAQVLETELR